MSSKVQWGIIATGAIASTFARNLTASRTGQLVAVGSRSKEKADKFGTEFGISQSGRHASYEALLADPNVQAVYVSTPHPDHAKWSLRAIEAGKHVLCEKPFALNYPQAMAVFEAATRKGVFVMEAFMYRCHPQTAKLVELLKGKTIGDVRLIRASFAFGAGFKAESRLFSNALAGGGIMDVGCYAASIARLVAGAAVGKDFLEPVAVSGAGKLGPTGVDHWAIASLKFETGAVAQLTTGVELNTDNTLRIDGSKGSIVVANPWVADRKQGGEATIVVNVQGEKEPRKIVIKSDVTSFTLEADAAGDAILAGRQQPAAPAMTWEDTLSNLRTLDAWRAAIGLEFNSEKPDAPEMKLTVIGRPLVRRQPVAIPSGRIAGLDKPVSRLIMGVDNQLSITHASIMFDDYYEQGGNAFDTAYIYGGGKLERMLGQWIKNRGLRDQIVVTTKGCHTPNCDPKSLTTQLKESLSRQGHDYTDIYMMHRDNPQIPAAEFIDVLNEHVKAGRIKVFGGSNWSIPRVEEANAYAKSKGLQGFSVLSNNFSLARMVKPVWGGCIAASDPQSRAWLTKTQMALLPWSSQARGFFTDRADLPADQQPDKSLVDPWYSDDNFERRKRAYELAQKHGVTPIAIALAYVLCQPFPTFALIGPRILSETRTSLPGVGVKLTPADLKYLNLEA